MDSEEDHDYYTSSDEYAAECGGDDADDGEILTKKPYTILKEETMKKLQQNDISEVSNVLAITSATACTLLLHHNWSVATVLDEWFADEDRVRSSVGIPTENPKRQKLEDNIYCKICTETVELRRTLSAACGHLFCSECWSQYVAVSINDGPGCLRLRCPEPKCAAVAGLDTVEAAAAAGDLQKFNQYLYRSYVESNRSRKWCPGPGCELAVEFDSGGGGAETYDVTCDCRHKFCWRCTEEQHRPITCETVAKWAEKNLSESENATWIIAYTKPCPKCKKKIEKNQGCNHMTCTCSHEFCWFCRQQWRSSGHVCNEYVREHEAAIDNSLIETREELSKYAHYYERWASNHKSREMAAADAARAREEAAPALAAAQEVAEMEVQFVAEAWEQVVECRRVLKWSYAYGYYLKERKKKEIFEFLQGQAEAALEKLHHCAEKEAAAFVAEAALEKFREFRWKLANLTRVTKQYFQNLVRALENDLSEVGTSS